MNVAGTVGEDVAGAHPDYELRFRVLGDHWVVMVDLSFSVNPEPVAFFQIYEYLTYSQR